MFGTKNLYVVDIETNSLLPGLKKMHVLGYGKLNRETGKWVLEETKDVEVIKEIFENEDNIVIGHYFKLFDIKALKILYPEVNFVARIVDTIGLSWALYDHMRSHGLEAWGEILGIPKVEVDESEWENMTYERAVERVRDDVRINILLFLKISKLLKDLYGEDEDAMYRFISYIDFKMDCLSDQEDEGLHISLPHVDHGLEKFEEMREERFSVLKEAMPKVPTYRIRNKPKQIFKKDGTLTKGAREWFELLHAQGLPEDYEEQIKIVSGYSDPNPNSVNQVKDWLFDMGWEPSVFKDSVRTSGEIVKVPQINIDGELCQSVLRLKDKNPSVEELDSLGIIRHRIGAIKSFRDSEVDGKVVCGASAFTSTMRLRHRRPIANMVRVNSKDIKNFSSGYWIRRNIVAPPGKLMFGSDMSSLEDRIKQHFLYPYDPEYVKEMMTEDFDPHLTLAQAAGLLTPQQVQDHKDGTAKYESQRDDSKTANYLLQYGGGVPKLAELLGWPESRARGLHKSYWDLNWAVKAVAEDAKVKTLDTRTYFDVELQRNVTIDRLWVYQPINGFWYPLRGEKDIFSALCQGGGVYCFDMWMLFAKRNGLSIPLQYHDEVAGYLEDSEEAKVETEKKLRNAIEKVNETIKLNVKLDIDVDFGYNYSQVH